MARTRAQILYDFDNPCLVDIGESGYYSHVGHITQKMLLEALLDIRAGLPATHSGDPVTIMDIKVTRVGENITYHVIYYGTDGVLGVDTNAANFTIVV